MLRAESAGALRVDHRYHEALARSRGIGPPELRRDVLPDAIWIALDVASVLGVHDRAVFEARRGQRKRIGGEGGHARQSKHGSGKGHFLHLGSSGFDVCSVANNYAHAKFRDHATSLSA